MNRHISKLLFSALLFLLVERGSMCAEAADTTPSCPKLPQMTYDEDALLLGSDCRSGLDSFQFIPIGQNR